MKIFFLLSCLLISSITSAFAGQLPIECNLPFPNCPVGQSWFISESNFESIEGWSAQYFGSTNFDLEHSTNPPYVSLFFCQAVDISVIRLNNIKLNQSAKIWSEKYQANLLPFDSASERLSQLCHSDWGQVTVAVETNSRFGNNREADFYFFYEGEDKPFLWFHAWDDLKGDICKLNDSQGIGVLTCYTKDARYSQRQIESYIDMKKMFLAKFERQIKAKFNPALFVKKGISYCQANFVDLNNRGGNFTKASEKLCEKIIFESKAKEFKDLLGCWKATNDIRTCKLPNEDLDIKSYMYIVNSVLGTK